MASSSIPITTLRLRVKGDHNTMVFSDTQHDVSCHSQVIANLNPLSYDLTRSKGRIDFNVRMNMEERLTAFEATNPQQLTFEELQNLPSIPAGTTAPQNPLKK